MPEPESFCKHVKEQIVDEKHATGLYQRIIELLDTTAWSRPPEWKEFVRALIQKIDIDEKSHLAILETIDRLICE